MTAATPPEGPSAAAGGNRSRAPGETPGARETPGAGAGAVHQFIPALIPRDATGSHTLLLRDALRRAGWRSEIFTEATHDELVAETLPATSYARHAEPGDVLVYQLCTSSMVADLLLERPEPLILDYHNVTHPDLYAGWEPATARRVTAAREQLRRLAPKATLGVAVSEFNERDLRAAGCRRTAVVPVLADLGRLAAPDPAVLARLEATKGQGGSDWLFVGRVVPSKAQHDLVKALWAYRRLYDPLARLHLVGSVSSPRYLRALRSFVADLDLGDAVVVTGEVSEPALAAYYAAADIYVSMSLHEGFGVPLVEAFRTGTPVVALAAGAVPSTVGDAALLLDRAEPLRTAAAVHRVLSDTAVRDRLVTNGRRRLESLSLDEAARIRVQLFAGVAGPPHGDPAAFAAGVGGR